MQPISQPPKSPPFVSPVQGLRFGVGLAKPSFFSRLADGAPTSEVRCRRSQGRFMEGLRGTSFGASHVAQFGPARHCCIPRVGAWRESRLSAAKFMLGLRLSLCPKRDLRISPRSNLFSKGSSTPSRWCRDVFPRIGSSCVQRINALVLLTRREATGPISARTKFARRKKGAWSRLLAIFYIFIFIILFLQISKCNVGFHTIPFAAGFEIGLRAELVGRRVSHLTSRLFSREGVRGFPGG